MCLLPAPVQVMPNGGSSYDSSGMRFCTLRHPGPSHTDWLLLCTMRHPGPSHTEWLLLCTVPQLTGSCSCSHFKGTLGYYIMLQFVSVVCGEDPRAGAPGAAPKVASWLRRSLRELVALV